MGRKLLIVTGPTAVGKSAWSIDLARSLGSPVISCDSRQFYKEMTIGTAVPDACQLAAVRHYFIQDRSVREPLTAGAYELEAMDLLSSLFAEGHDSLVMCGGSMFYIEAVCSGLPAIPDADPELRESLGRRLREEGLEALRMDLRTLDPEAYGQIDLANPARVLRAVEVCLLSGRKFSSFRSPSPRRDFEIEKICLVRPREELIRLIDLRVESMLERGLVDEVRSLIPLRDLTPLKTVGYSEIFDCLDGRLSLDEAASRIKAATRRYAKKQLTWWKRDPSVRFVQV